MIDERMEEQASLYVLGALSAEEQRAFEGALEQNAELRQLVEALRVSRDAMAGNVPLVEPPPQLRQRTVSMSAICASVWRPSCGRSRRQPSSASARHASTIRAASPCRVFLRKRR